MVFVGGQACHSSSNFEAGMDGWTRAMAREIGSRGCLGCGGLRGLMCMLMSLPMVWSRRIFLWSVLKPFQVFSLSCFGRAGGLVSLLAGQKHRKNSQTWKVMGTVSS